MDQVRLCDFIEWGMEAILREWESFAATLLPAAIDMNSAALRDHAEQILGAVCMDLKTSQNDEERERKSKGLTRSLIDAPNTAAETHALLRALSGFNLNQMVSEYRALRASVLHLWARACEPSQIFLPDVIRFNEAIDEAVSESVAFFCAQVEKERNQAEMAALQHLNEMAHVLRVASVGELTAGLAHELRQPLAAILSNAQAAQHLVGDQVELNAIRSILSDIVTDNRRAGEVIATLRKLRKKSAFEPERLDVNELIQDVLKLMNYEFKSQQVRVVTELDDDMPIVLADRVQLQQVLINLILNAVEAMAHQTEKSRTLTLKSRRDGDAVQISVADTGSGISAGDEEKIFERYHTTKSRGLGLGLPLSRSILLAQGGRIWAENASVAGATLYFMLPKWEDRSKN